jgi:hypothetical protein
MYSVNHAESLQVKSKYKPLLSLPPEKLHDLNKLIFTDSKILLAAKKLKEDYGLYKDTPLETLRLYVQAYKKEFKDTWHQFNLGNTVHVSQPVPPELKTHIPANVGDPKLMQWIPFGKVKVLLEQAMTKFDSMTELERVTLMQYERVVKVMEYEASLPDEVKGKDGKMVKNLTITDNGGKELANLHNMLKTLVSLQMELGIRHKVETPSQHLHLDLTPQHQKLMTDFETMKKVTDVTAKAMALITSKRGEVQSVTSDDFEDDLSETATPRVDSSGDYHD